MKRVLVDSEGNIIYDGLEAKYLHQVLLADVADVTEADEVKWEKELRGLEWKGKLEYQAHFDLTFRGIDDWNRPVFKDIDSILYFGDVNKLWVARELGKDNKIVNDYYRDHPEGLEYFGDHFNCEPHGGTQEFFRFKIKE